MAQISTRKHEDQKLDDILQRGRALFYKRVLQGWSQSSSFEAPDRAESLLWEMQRHYDAESQSGNHQASESMRPGRGHYNKVITAWGRSGRPGAPANAKEIFDIAVEQFQMGNSGARPNTSLYLSVIYASAVGRDLNQVDNYVDLLLADCAREGNIKHSPVHVTSSTLNEILKAICIFCRKHENLAHARELADAVFQRITDFGVQPDEESHRLRAHIRACGGGK